MHKLTMFAMGTVLAAAAGLGTPVYSAQSRSFPTTGAIQDRYCLQGREYGYPGSCGFSTYSQCRASASGTESGCGINPMYAYARQRQQIR